MQKQKLGVAVLTETKIKGTYSETVGDYLHIYSGVDKGERAKAGVAILIHKKLKRY